MRRHAALFFAIAIAGAALDLLTKHLAFKYIQWGEEIQIIDGFFSYGKTTNPGVIFGKFPGAKTLWMWISILAIPAILWIFFAAKKRRWILTITLGMIMAGTIGNMYDRVWTEKGEVRDFIKFYYVRGHGTDEEVALLKSQGLFGSCQNCESSIGSWRQREYPNAIYCSRCREAVWPLFNLADSFICVGVFLLTIEMLFFDEKKKKETKDELAPSAAPAAGLPSPSEAGGNVQVNMNLLNVSPPPEESKSAPLLKNPPTTSDHDSKEQSIPED